VSCARAVWYAILACSSSRCLTIATTTATTMMPAITSQIAIRLPLLSTHVCGSSCTTFSVSTNAGSLSSLRKWLVQSNFRWVRSLAPGIVEQLVDNLPRNEPPDRGENSKPAATRSDAVCRVSPAISLGRAGVTPWRSPRRHRAVRPSAPPQPCHRHQPPKLPRLGAQAGRRHQPRSRGSDDRTRDASPEGVPRRNIGWCSSPREVMTPYAAINRQSADVRWSSSPGW
jgi:hypothetical protein